MQALDSHKQSVRSLIIKVIEFVLEYLLSIRPHVSVPMVPIFPPSPANRHHRN
jgi:hypothetical protein